MWNFTWTHPSDPSTPAVYCFKKALLTIHAINLRFGSSSSSVPVPRTTHLPIFSDNVIPSILVHLGIIDLSTSNQELGLASLFPEAGTNETLELLLTQPPLVTDGNNAKPKEIPKEGPVLTKEQAFILRAAAVDACELIIQTAQNLTDEDLKPDSGENHDGAKENLSWLKDITLPEVDAWIWSIAKDRADYRKLERFVLTGTTYF